MNVKILPKLRRSKEIRIKRGQKLLEDIRDYQISTLDCKDIVFAMGYEAMSVPAKVDRILEGIKKEQRDGEVYVSLAEFKTKIKPKRDKEVSRKNSGVVVTTVAANPENTFNIHLQSSIRNFIVKLAKHKNLTVPALISRILEQKMTDTYAEVEARIFSEFDV